MPFEQAVPESVATGPDAPEIVVDLTLQQRSNIIGDVYLLDDTHFAKVFGPDEDIVDGIIELEVEQLVALGDREDESRAWLADRTSACWLAVFRRGAPQTAEHVEGILRLTGPGGSDRMLRDLGVLVGKDPETVAQEIADHLGIESLRPFSDMTTLDVTPLGAPTKEARFATLLRLMCCQVITGLRTSQTSGVDAHCALVHPRVLKHIVAAGIPVHSAGYGILKYKLTESNTNPMETTFGMSFGSEVAQAIRVGESPFLREVGSIMTESRLTLEGIGRVNSRGML